jgi:hypothetical protein
MLVDNARTQQTHIDNRVELSGAFYNERASVRIIETRAITTSTAGNRRRAAQSREDGLTDPP